MRTKHTQPIPRRTLIARVFDEYEVRDRDLLERVDEAFHAFKRRSLQQKTRALLDLGDDERCWVLDLLVWLEGERLVGANRISFRTICDWATDFAADCDVETFGEVLRALHVNWLDESTCHSYRSDYFSTYARNRIAQFRGWEISAMLEDICVENMSSTYYSCAREVYQMRGDFHAQYWVCPSNFHGAIGLT